MKPYLAIIYDSFVEAINSKVLWVLLVLWVLVLGALAPFQFIQDVSYRISSWEIVSQESLVRKLSTAASKSKGTPAQLAIVNSLSDSSKKKLVEQEQNEKRISQGALAAMLNEAIENPSLYSEEAWPRAERRSELKDLLAKPADQRSKSETQHLNRRLVEQAFSGQLQPVNENKVWIGYAGWKMSDDPLPVSLKQAREFVESMILQLILKVGLGVFAVGASIIVTSPMIPDMFQTGSLHLLLSKPISRSLLFLTKFLGGCVFVAINIAFFLTGLYLVAGSRLGIWNQGLLLCIPVCIFIFIIFYTVSALAGLIWKNAIVCVVFTVLFWLLCFFLGFAQGVMKPFAQIFPEIVEIQQVGDRYVGAQYSGTIVTWDEKTKAWKPAFDSRRGGGEIRALGPFWFPKEGELYFARAPRRPMGGIDGEIKPTVVRLPELASQPTEGADSDSTEDLFGDARTDSVPAFPDRTRRVISNHGELLVLSESGVYRFDRTAIVPKAENNNIISGFVERALQRAASVKNDTYKKISPDDWLLKSPMDFAANQKSILVYSQGTLYLLNEAERTEKGEAAWTVASELAYSTEKSQLALVAVNDTHWLAVGAGLKARFGSLANFQDSRELDELPTTTPRRIIVSPTTGDFLIATDEGDLWQITSDGSRVLKPNLTGQGDVKVANFTAQGELLVSHHVGDVDRWDLSANKATSLIRPTPNTLQRIYRYAVNPLYYVNPKPAALDDTISYCLTKKQSVGLNLDTSSLDDSKPKLDPWQPLWSNGVFIAIMLGVCCLYLRRQDL